MGFHAEAEAESTRPSSPAKENLRRDGVEVRGGLEEEEESEVDVDDDGDDDDEEEMPKGAVATDRFLKGPPVITRLLKRRALIENHVHDKHKKYIMFFAPAVGSHDLPLNGSVLLLLPLLLFPLEYGPGG